MQHLLALVTLVSGLAALPAPDPAKLRRIPRIYNALITSDEQLLPSQAYPAVAPVLRPAPLAYNPYNLALPPIQDQYGVYSPDVYGAHSYSRIPGFNDTLRDPEAAQRPLPVYNLQPQQTVPQITDDVKNNRPPNRDIPDVPPPPLPVSPPRSRDNNNNNQGRNPQEYPPAPPQGLPFL